jgi:hypothetical protein
LSLPPPLHLLQPSLPPSPSPPLSPSPQPPLTSPPELIRRHLTLGLVVTTARQGAMPWSSRHGGEVWRYEMELGVGRSQIRIRVEQVLSKF